MKRKRLVRRVEYFDRSDQSRQGYSRAQTLAGVRVGSLTLANPVMTASGTAGHGAELHAFADLGLLGAHVVKSLAAFPWSGNPAPRIHPTGAGMLNAVGLQGPGIAAWLRDDLPKLAATNAKVVVSIWGRSVQDYADAAALLEGASEQIVAVEVNLSCPNLEGHTGIFAHDADLSATVIEATAVCGKPRWAKLSPNTDRIVAVASAVVDAGAESLTIANTLLGMAIDTDNGRPVLGAGGGGYSGRAIHAVSVRAVHDVRAALADISIIGVGGISSGLEAAEMMMAGADAVQVGTATFADPRAAWNILGELRSWAATRQIEDWSDLTSLVHRGGWR